jgi:dipeptidyl aminopeptidase/acylaminoacyl peptidase
MLIIGALAAPARPAEPPLIPRTSFFGNPVKTGAQISPDGRWLSWVAPRDGVLNVWAAPYDAPGRAKALTAEKGRPVAGYWWSPESRMILYATDNGGDENFQLYGVDVTTGARRVLTSFARTRVSVLAISHTIQDRILISANNRDPRYFDVLSLDLKTGAITPVFRNEEGFASFLADDALTLRLATRTLPSGDRSVYRITAGKAEPQPVETIPYEDVVSTFPGGYSYDGKTLFWLDSRGRDTAALIAQDVATGARTVLGEDPRADISAVAVSAATGRIQAYGANYLRMDWTVLDPAFRPDWELLRRRLKGEISIDSRSRADDKWLVDVSDSTLPGQAWLYDRRTRTLTRLFSSRPELDGAPLAPMQPLEIKARDGLTLVSYLTLPPGAAPGRPVPLVLSVHGGPTGRDVYSYFDIHQWLANRGYAVLSVNFRGSAGFGKRFTAAGDLEWGRRMQDDLIDAVDWAVAHGVTTRDKLAIGGASYGGYAVLAGLAFTPDVFACGVDLFGPVNLNTLFSNTPTYWTAELADMRRRFGDPTTPEGQAMLTARSPVTAAGAIRRPLLIGQGVNDVRVRRSESDQMVAALKAKGIPVTYLLFADEGHGFRRPENQLAFNAVTEQFLRACLGGRAEPIGDALKGSTITTAAGADLIPGLAEARQEPRR